MLYFVSVWMFMRNPSNWQRAWKTTQKSWSYHNNMDTGRWFPLTFLHDNSALWWNVRKLSSLVIYKMQFKGTTGTLRIKKCNLNRCLGFNKYSRTTNASLFLVTDEKCLYLYQGWVTVILFFWVNYLGIRNSYPSIDTLRFFLGPA